MSEFGHYGFVIDGVGCFDSWGAGPFVIDVAGQRFRFEDSDRFGPALLTAKDELRANPYPPERSPFWRAHRIWKRQGRRLQADGIVCIWDEPKPTTFYRIGRRSGMVVESGEEDGEHIEVPSPDARSSPVSSPDTPNE